jgi:hypothetical protein
MEETKIHTMTTLEQTLRTSHDWAVNRINILNKKIIMQMRKQFVQNLMNG